MENFFDQDKARAIVFLLTEDDRKNRMMISDEQLLVIRNNQKDHYNLNELSHLKSDQKKALLPLILGGIITPFAFLSYFVNLFHPWIHLFSILTGIFLFYYGWIGRSVLSMVFKNGEEIDYFLPSISKNLQAFIDFSNKFINDTVNLKFRKLLFFEIESKYKSLLTEKELVDSKSNIFPLFGYTYDQLKGAGKSAYQKNLVAIDPSTAGREIKFSFDQKANMMRPQLPGPVLEKSIVSPERFLPDQSKSH